MMYRIRNWLVATLLLLCAHVGAATLSDIQVSNGNQQARITLSFIGDPDYAFSHQSKRTVALDIKQTGVIQGLPLLFSGNNLVKAIRSGTPKDAQTLRLVVDLTENGKTEAVKRQNGSNYTVVFTINADAPPPPPPPPVVAKRVETPAVVAPRVSEPARNPFKTESNRTTGVISSNTVTRRLRARRLTLAIKLSSLLMPDTAVRTLALSAPVVRGRKMSPSPSRVNCVLCSMTIRCLRAF